MPRATAADVERMAALRRLYAGLSEAERARIDDECLRLRQQLGGERRVGPETAFEIVMSVRLLAMRIVEDD